MTYITVGSGRRFVGKKMKGFKKNDLVLVGSDLPHCWKLDTEKNKEGGSVVAQFHHDFLGKHFWQAPEMEPVQKLLKRSGAGIEFRGKIKEEIKDMLDVLFHEKNILSRLIHFLEILNKLSVTKEYTLLNKKNPAAQQSDINRERANKVIAYIVENFHNDVSLNEAAQTIGMTPNAFCKYFKRTTRKTFIEMVTDYRINYATQQLVETEKSIGDICFESGFRDMSHFYKTFTLRMDMSPLNYRKQFLKETAE
jgi:AraC-like DNA-binding protein